MSVFWVPAPNSSMSFARGPSNSLKYQFNSILMPVYLGIAPDSIGWGFSPIGPPPPLPTPTPEASHCLGCYLYFWPASSKADGSLNPLSSIIFLECVTKLRKPIYLQDYRFSIKGNNSETARWKGCVGLVLREGAQSLHALSRYTILPNLHGFNLEAL